MPSTAPASSSVSEAIEIEPLLVVAPDTSRAAKFVPLPVRSTVPLLTKDSAVTASDDERLLMPISSVPVLVSPVAIDRVEPPEVVNRRVEADSSAVGQRPGRRHRRRAGRRPREVVERVPAMSESPVSALFEPRAVLSSMKALFPERVNSEEAAIVLICPLRNSIAECRGEPHRSGQRSRDAEARAARRHVEERWLRHSSCRRVRAGPILSIDVAVTLSDAERLGW